METAGAGVWMTVGSLVFLIGAFTGVPRVFLEPNPEARLLLLEQHLILWRVAQPLYLIGPVMASIGVGVLAAADGVEADAVAPLAASCVLLLAGCLFWGGDVLPRMVRHRDFALGTLPGWPFVGYVWTTIAGFVALGWGLLSTEIPAWTGWMVLVADLGFALFYVAMGDIPPFFFYLLLLIVGVVLVWGAA